MLDKLAYPDGSCDWCCGKGRVLCHEASPKSFADSVEFEATYKPLLEKTGIQVERCDGFSMRRGDYVIAHALGEDLQMEGTFVDVFSPDLKVCEDVVVSAGTGGLFKCFDPTATPSVIHSTCGLMDQGLRMESCASPFAGRRRPLLPCGCRWENIPLVNSVRRTKIF